MGPLAGIWGEDPVKLTVALKMTRQDLTRTQMELNTMKANFGDVVPRRDFEMQEKTNKGLQEQVLEGRPAGQGRAGARVGSMDQSPCPQLDSLRDDYKEVRKEHEILLQLHMSTLKERDQFYSELQEIQRTSTPRPDWTKCEGNDGHWGPRTAQVCGPDSSSLSPLADVVAGGPGRWQILAEGKNSDQLVDVLLEEIGEGLLREKDFFSGLVRESLGSGLGPVRMARPCC